MGNSANHLPLAKTSGTPTPILGKLSRKPRQPRCHWDDESAPSAATEFQPRPDQAQPIMKSQGSRPERRSSGDDGLGDFDSTPSRHPVKRVRFASPEIRGASFEAVESFEAIDSIDGNKRTTIRDPLDESGTGKFATRERPDDRSICPGNDGRKGQNHSVCSSHIGTVNVRSAVKMTQESMFMFPLIALYGDASACWKSLSVVG